MICLECSPLEFRFIRKIVDRAVNGHADINRKELEMDILAAHANGCPLDLEEFLAFSDADFMHDVFGIRRHINRKTGELTDCFLPRCAI